jgi:hypothetical protein
MRAAPTTLHARIVTACSVAPFFSASGFAAFDRRAGLLRPRLVPAAAAAAVVSVTVAPVAVSPQLSDADVERLLETEVNQGSTRDPDGVSARWMASVDFARLRSTTP